MPVRPNWLVTRLPATTKCSRLNDKAVVTGGLIRYFEISLYALSTPAVD
jgi:hypothetical protein